MRLLIALAAVAICTYIGRRRADALNVRTTILHAVADDITRLFSVMDYSMLPVAELFTRITPCKAPLLWDTLNSNMESNDKLYAAYVKTMRELKKEDPLFSKLTDNETILFDDFFRLLGTGNIDAERKNAALATDRIRAFAVELDQKRKQAGKAYSSLGLLSGLALAIIIL